MQMDSAHTPHTAARASTAPEKVIVLDPSKHHPKNVEAIKQLVYIGIEHQRMQVLTAMMPLYSALLARNSGNQARSSRDDDHLNGTIWASGQMGNGQVPASPERLLDIIQTLTTITPRVDTKRRGFYDSRGHARQGCTEALKAYAKNESLEPILEKYITDMFMNLFEISYAPELYRPVNFHLFNQVLAAINIPQGSERYEPLRKRVFGEQLVNPVFPFDQHAHTLHLTDLFGNLAWAGGESNMWQNFGSEMTHMLAIYTNRVDEYFSREEKTDNFADLKTYLVEGLFDTSEGFAAG